MVLMVLLLQTKQHFQVGLLKVTQVEMVIVKIMNPQVEAAVQAQQVKQVMLQETAVMVV